MWLFLNIFALLFAARSLASPVADQVRRQATTTTSSALQTQSGIVCNCNSYYTVVSGDSCSGIVSKYNNAFTLNQFYSWNPAVGSSCQSLWVGYQVCVGVNSAQTCTTTSTTSTSPTTSSVATSTVSSTTTTAATGTCVTVSNSGPQPEQTSIAWNCNAYYLVASGDSCSSIVSKYNNFTLNQFYSWNPAVGSSCGSLWVGYYVCIGVNTAQAVSCAPTSTSTSTTPATSKTSVTTSSIIVSTTGTWWYISSRQIDPQPTPTIYATQGVPSPVQAGIQPGCQSYYQAVQGDNCSSITNSFFGFDTAQFISWNPGVGSTCSNVISGDYYCVQPSIYNPGPPTYSSVDPNLLPNCYIQNCTAWYLAGLNDTCTSIPSKFGYNLTYADFLNWNPSINWTNCTGFAANQYYCINWLGSNMTPAYSNVSYYSNSSTSNTTVTNTTLIFYGYPNTTCTSTTYANATSTGNSTLSATVNATTTTSMMVTSNSSTTTKASVTSTSSTPSSTSSGGPQPQQSGIVANCNKYYLVASGDSCASIETAYNITATQFFAWNTGINSGCTNLYSGYYCCVGVSGSSSSSTPASATPTTTSTPVTTSTSTSTAAAAPSPTQSGLAANCNAYYDVVSGDSCQGIVNKFGNFTLNQFYSWNPAVGSSCGSLWVGYYVCIGVPGSSTSTTTSSLSTSTTASKTSVSTTTTTTTSTTTTPTSISSTTSKPTTTTTSISTTSTSITSTSSTKPTTSTTTTSSTSNTSKSTTTTSSTITTTSKATTTTR